MIRGGWKTATLDFNRSSEFTGDDVDQFTSLVNLGKPCQKVTIVLPTIESSTVSVYGQDGDSIATVPKVVHVAKPNTLGTGAWVTTAGTGLVTVVCDLLGGYQYIRIRCNTNQTADRAILVKGE